VAKFCKLKILSFFYYINCPENNIPFYSTCNEYNKPKNVAQQVGEGERQRETDREK